MDTPTYTTTGRGRSIVGWGAVGSAVGVFIGALLRWAGAPDEVIGAGIALGTAAVPPLIGLALPDDS